MTKVELGQIAAELFALKQDAQAKKNLADAAYRELSEFMDNAKRSIGVLEREKKFIVEVPGHGPRLVYRNAFGNFVVEELGKLESSPQLVSQG